MNKPVSPAATIRGEEHWTNKGSDVRLFLWNKNAGDPSGPAGRILFVHGSSMASQPTFDLQGGRADASVMDFFAARGYDTWCVDMEGYGRSTKTRDNNAPIAYGADDCFAAASYIEKLRGKRPLLVYGISSGALRAALFAQRHPEMVARLALDAMVWTGEGSPTLAERSKRLPEFRAKNRRPIDRKFVRSIFERDHPGTADDAVIEAFADAILALDEPEELRHLLPHPGELLFAARAGLQERALTWCPPVPVSGVPLESARDGAQGCRRTRGAER
jgi:pimeloyl-ACP methyl ester carboxylesterase